MELTRLLSSGDAKLKSNTLTFTVSVPVKQFELNYEKQQELITKIICGCFDRRNQVYATVKLNIFICR